MRGQRLPDDVLLPVHDEIVARVLQLATAAAFRVTAGRAHPHLRRRDDARRLHDAAFNLALDGFAGKGAGDEDGARRDAVPLVPQPFDRDLFHAPLMPCMGTFWQALLCRYSAASLSGDMKPPDWCDQ
ncbi:hypothetical protein GCM10011326_22370 [Salipiger profundus]|nr:hypothetical protein GCM10011326_22370 [Salipiger profundus]